MKHLIIPCLLALGLLQEVAIGVPFSIKDAI